MLGLGNASTTGSAHEQMYSLDLDGVLDRLVIGDVLDFGTNDFVISLWHKVADYSAETAFLMLKQEDNNNKWYIAQINDGTFGVLVINGGNTTLNDVTADASALEGSWVNIIVVCDRSSATGGVIYVNGATTLGKSAFAPDDDDSPENISISADLTIGSQTGGASAILGNIDEVAIWTHADLSDFDSNAAAAVYNSGKPFDLNYNRGDYDAFTGKLVGYWRMGNGPFDDKANGVVHDAHNPGFGAELYTGTSGDDANWALVGDMLMAEDDGAVRLTNDGSTTSSTKLNFQSSTGEFSTNLTVGATYIVSYLTKVNSGSSVAFKAYTDVNNFGGYVNSTDYVNSYIYFVATSTNINSLQVSGLSTGEIVWIKNISLRKVNGFPGIAAADATFSADTPDD